MDLRAHAEELLAGNLYATLGTVGADGRPWTTPVYCAADGVERYYWVSSTDSRHSINLAATAAVSLVVFDSTVAPYTGRAVYAEGSASVLTGDALARGLTVYPGHPGSGAGTLTVDDVSGDARWRLYGAVATSAWVLCPTLDGVPCELHARTDDHRARVLP